MAPVNRAARQLLRGEGGGGGEEPLGAGRGPRLLARGARGHGRAARGAALALPRRAPLQPATALVRAVARSAESELNAPFRRAQRSSQESS